MAFFLKDGFFRVFRHTTPRERREKSFLVSCLTVSGHCRSEPQLLDPRKRRKEVLQPGVVPEQPIHDLPPRADHLARQ